MKDHEYILSEINKNIKDTLESIENRIVSGGIITMEDYKFNLGIRYALTKLEDYIKLVSREDGINE
jgi:hypothetical protein